MGYIVLKTIFDKRREYIVDTDFDTIKRHSPKPNFARFNTVISYAEDADDNTATNPEPIGRLTGIAIPSTEDFFAIMSAESKRLGKLAEALCEGDNHKISEKYINYRFPPLSISTSWLMAIDLVYLPHMYKGINVYDEVFKFLPYVLPNDLRADSEGQGLFVSAYDDKSNTEGDGAKHHKANIKLRKSLVRNGYISADDKNYAYDWRNNDTSPFKWC